MDRALRLASLLLPAIAALAVGCSGGGGGDDGGGGGGALRLESSTPANGASGVGRGAALQLVFSAPLDPATVTADSVALSDGGGEVAASRTLSTDGRQLSVVPASRLAKLGAYALTVTTAVRGADGSALAAPVVVAFSAADGRWGVAQTIPGLHEDDASTPSVAAAPGGAALAVWRQAGPFTYTVIASSPFTPGVGWGDAERASEIGLPGNVGGYAGSPEIGMDAEGNGTLVWTQPKEGGPVDVYANRLAVGAGWVDLEGAAIEEDETGDLAIPQLAVDAEGNATAVWRGPDRLDVWANRSSAGTGWGTAAPIDASDGEVESVAVGAGGGAAIVVWAQRDAFGNTSVHARRHAEGAWEAEPRRLDASPLGYAVHPHVALDGAGNALAVWIEAVSSSNVRPFSRRYDAASGWQDREPIGPAVSAILALPRPAISPGGHAVAVWLETVSNVTSVVASRRRPGGAWEEPAPIEASAASAWAPSVAMDVHGNALAVWIEEDGDVAIRGNRLSAAGGWGTAAWIETDLTRSAGDWPRLAMDGDGNAFAIWSRYTGEGPSGPREIRVNRFE